MIKERAFFPTLILLALVGIFLVLYATPEGLGLSDDSIAYVAGARSILSGGGYREAYLASNGYVTHFPPVFSITLAFIGLSGMDPLRAARFLVAFLFGANIFLSGIIGWRMTKSQLAGIALALLFLVNDSLFNVHVVAMSEPLYIFFTLAAFLTFAFFFNTKDTKDTKGEWKWLVATGVLTSLAYLTRYAGLALFATFLIALILLQDNWKKRLTSAGIFIASFLPLALAWSIRNKLVTDNATNRTFVYHPLTEEHVNSFIYNISEFLIPVESWRRAMVKDVTTLFVFVGIIALVLFIWTATTGLKKFFQPSSAMPEVLSFTNGLYVFGYLASIVSSMLFFDQATKFKLRILAPVYVALLILLVYFLYSVITSRRWSSRAGVLPARTETKTAKQSSGGVEIASPLSRLAMTIVVTILYLSILFFSLPKTYASAQTLHASGGQGLASFKWYDSKAMDFLAKLPANTRIYTNQPGAVYLYANHPALVLPDLVDSVTGLPRGNFEEGAVLLQKDVLSGKAVLALFDTGAESEEAQKVYDQISAGLYLALQTQGDKIYTAP
jgi:4-amino-4-deoxy-L-arabinose transferase-like glycosyltransferase